LDEDRHCPRHRALDLERAHRLQIEERDLPRVLDARDLGAQRSGALAPGELDVFEEVSRPELLGGLLFREEPVLAAVLPALPALPGRRRDGEREIRDLDEQRFFQGPFPRTRGAGYDEKRRTTG